MPDMLKPATPDPALVAFSGSVYRLLLAFYPARFRRDYGVHMAQVFRDCSRAAVQRGGGAFALFWLTTLVDWFKTVIREQLNGETEMSREKICSLEWLGADAGSYLAAANFRFERPD
ncbi:MAG: hypothetical protein HC806_03390 [Anaerolineae bacterium]|nr:hypothetical protein [Anaerolineae bacterium]